MKNVPRFLRIIGLIFGLTVALWPTAVLAHDGSARVVLNQYQIAPGQLLEVSGINLGTDLAVQVKLVGVETAVALGTALCDGHGDFIQSYTLPADLPEGVFLIQVIDSSITDLPRVLAEASFQVDDAATTLTNKVVYTSRPFWRSYLPFGIFILVVILFFWPLISKQWSRQKNSLPQQLSPLKTNNGEQRK